MASHYACPSEIDWASRHFFASGCQFVRSVIGADASSSTVLIQEAPIGEPRGYTAEADGRNGESPVRQEVRGTQARELRVDALSAVPARGYREASAGDVSAWQRRAGSPKFFAAAVICCGSSSTEDGTEAPDTPLWNLHGDADQTVPASVSRNRIAAGRKAGGRPLYTEYPGVDHNSWQWAYTEPETVKWLFAQRRKN
jgi:pimeloyl-ACP methyl ester carboxylesterase